MGQGLNRIGGSDTYRSGEPLMESDPTRMCELLVGLPDVRVLGVSGDPRNRQEQLVVRIESKTVEVGCAQCGTRATVKDRSEVRLVDLPAFGRPAILLWYKRRWQCPEPDCPTKTWTEQAVLIPPPRAGMTDRTGRWVTVQVGCYGRTVAEVARELGTDWHTVMAAVMAYGTPLVEDPNRIGPVTALGLDETLFVRSGRWRTQSWCTSIVGLDAPSQLLDVVPGRNNGTLAGCV